MDLNYQDNQSATPPPIPKGLDEPFRLSNLERPEGLVTGLPIFFRFMTVLTMWVAVAAAFLSWEIFHGPQSLIPLLLAFVGIIFSRREWARRIALVLTWFGAASFLVFSLFVTILWNANTLHPTYDLNNDYLSYFLYGGTAILVLQVIVLTHPRNLKYFH